MKLVGMVRARTEVSLVPVSELEVKTGTCGIPYKFAMLKSPKINTLWEPFCHFLLEYQNLTRAMELEIGNIKIKHI